jgi:hypothetical protein
MKKLSILLFFVPVILFSCKSEHASGVKPSGKKFKVSFNVTNFAKQNGAFSVKQTGKLSVNDLIDPKDYVDVLYYIVYDTNGQFSLHTITQDSTLNTMGSITDSLPSGNYPIYIFAGKKGLSANQLSALSTATYGYGSNYWLDTFWSGFNVTVGSTDISQSVTLARTVSKLELQILDNIPSNANSIQMTIYPDAQTQSISSGLPKSAPIDTAKVCIIIPLAAKGHTNFTIDKLLGGMQTVNVSIICRDASNNIIGSGSASNVSVKANIKTILSGNLFNGGPTSNTQTFTLKADTAWGSTLPFSF